MNATGTPRVCDRVEIKVYKQAPYVLQVDARLTATTRVRPEIEVSGKLRRCGVGSSNEMPQT
jgi:hypothetical protein